MRRVPRWSSASKNRGTTKVTAEDLLGESNDQAFADAIKAQGKTVLAYSFGTLNAAGPTKGVLEQGFTTEMILPAPLSYNLARIPPGMVRELFGSTWYRPPIPILNQAAHSTGYVPIDSDDDGVMRAQIMVARFHDGNRVPLSLAVLKALAGDGNLILNFGALGDQKVIIQNPNGETEREFPVNEHGQMLVNFRGPEGTFPHLSFTDILNHRVPASDLLGKIVLVGATARGLGDRFNTPEGGGFSRASRFTPTRSTTSSRMTSSCAAPTTRSNGSCGLVLGLLMVLAASFLPANLTAMAAVTLGGSYTLIARQMLWHDHRLIGIVYPLADVGLHLRGDGRIPLLRGEQGEALPAPRLRALPASERHRVGGRSSGGPQARRRAADSLRSCSPIS